ncbi:hypothetical protein KA107_01830 [Candidatus Pacearchaeota archaeon]|nr:hypothetical protein [Candidatus Pacearchaeota archaeon]
MKLQKVQIVLTVPKTHTKKVLTAIGNAGGGIIGNYSHCSFTLNGIGRFKPNKDATPFIGKSEKLEEVKEDMIQFRCNLKDARKIITALKKVHPYEELAMDIHPLLMEEDLP